MIRSAHPTKEWVEGGGEEEMEKIKKWRHQGGAGKGTGRKERIEKKRKEESKKQDSDNKVKKLIGE